MPQQDSDNPQSPNPSTSAETRSKITNREIVSVQSHFTEAGLDYEYWSPVFNMHFGYWKWGANPFGREAMLRELNRQVGKRLSISGASPKILDMGCGVGAPVRDMARLYPTASVTGVTIVPWQIQKATELTGDDLMERISFLEADFTDVPLESGSQDAVFAMASGYAG